MTTAQIPLARGRVAESSVRTPAFAGARDIAPALLALVPFGLTVGATVAESPVHDGIGWIGAALIYGGSAHVTAVSLLSAGASSFAIVIAVLLLSAREAVYSAGLVSRMQGQPAWFRWAAPYMLVDPLYAAVVSRTSERDPAAWVRWYYLGAGLAIWLMWLPTVGLGILLGPALPHSAAIDFALPALLIAFLVPGLKSRAALAAALAGGLLGVVAYSLPGGLGLIVATGVGAAAGVVCERTAR